jgi:DnaJ-class molecular chaperone
MVIKKISGFEKPILEEKINFVNIPHGVNFYDILGVDRTASKGKITKAFNELSLNEHPDKKGGVRTEKFDLLEKAKSVLLESKNEYNNLIDNEG